MLRVEGLTKRYGETLAVDHVTFDVKPGVVTGFLGPNGAGKSTTMRLILGLDAPTAGTATINGKPYRELSEPIRDVGALLEAKAIQGGRSAYNHLLWIATAGGLPKSRVEEVIGLVGLTDVAHRKADGFSLGMSQRLGIATALLGDPGTLLFDEPVNGLDPEGIVWMRNLLKRLAAEGRTVFVSSHLMSEMQETAEHVIVIGRGHIIADMDMDEFIRGSVANRVRVVSPRAQELAAAIMAAGGTVVVTGDDGLEVTGIEASQIGELALAKGIALHELAPQSGSLEEAFIELTQEDVQYQALKVPEAPEEKPV
jgi:ABC-2 type transport system ATP-binding protein